MWLALGMAVGSKQLLVRLLTEVPEAAFRYGSLRDLRRALAAGTAREALARLGLVLREDQTAAEALLEAARSHGEREAQEEFARKIDRASQLLKPEDFREYARRLVEELSPHAGQNRNGHSSRVSDSCRAEGPAGSAAAEPAARRTAG
jgi:hypothetical protein